MQYLHYLALLLMIGIGSSSILAQTVPDISAVGLSKSIGIATSKTCNTMHQNNFTTQCPTIEWLVSLGLDTSDQRITVAFVTEDNGWYHRENPILVNHYRFYDFDNEWNIFVDPPGDMRDRMKMIYIESDLQDYKIRGELKKIDNTRILHQDRYINSCHDATIGSDNILEMLPDTIYFMRNGCSGYTAFEDTYEIIDPTTEQDITTSQKYIDQQRHDWIIKNCLGVYGECSPP